MQHSCSKSHWQESVNFFLLWQYAAIFFIIVINPHIIFYLRRKSLSVTASQCTVSEPICHQVEQQLSHPAPGVLCSILALYNRGRSLPQLSLQVFTSVSHLCAFCNQSAPCCTAMKWNTESISLSVLLHLKDGPREAYTISLKGIVLTFWEISLFAFLLRVKWEDWNHSHICPLNMKLQPGDG